MLALAVDPGEPDGGELAGLLELLTALDVGQAAAVELAGAVQRDGLAERSAALPLEGLLSFRSRATVGDRRMLLSAGEQLPSLPCLRRAFHSGVVGWAQVRAILAQARPLDARQRAELDAGFAGLEHLARFELDPAAYGPVAAAIQAATAPPSAGPNDITTHAPDHGPGSESHHGDAGDVAPLTPDGAPAFTDPIGHRAAARQRADALVRLAETFLAGSTPWHTLPASSGTQGADTAAEGDAASDAAAAATTGWPAGPRSRARPSIQAVCDIGQLIGDDTAARATRGLLATPGGPVRLTPRAIRRLACDARLQLLITDRGEVLGTTDPVETIPVALRRALHARDQGCRFPGCTAPIHWTDAHHVRFRRHGGPTTLDNLVLLCRRHHTAVHEGGWRLTLAPTGTLTVQRGRHSHTSHPPWHRTLTTTHGPDATRGTGGTGTDPPGEPGPEPPDTS